jgi:hypothetical protein
VVETRMMDVFYRLTNLASVNQAGRDVGDRHGPVIVACEHHEWSFDRLVRTAAVVIVPANLRDAIPVRMRTALAPLGRM